MLFSIIIPMYNVEKYVERCLKSILSQSFFDYELILVDDGSTDNTVSVVEDIILRYINCDIKLIKQENSGASEARNKGIQVAKGEYLIFVDADDQMVKNALNIMAQAAEKTADLCVFSLYKEKNGEVIPSKLSTIEGFYIHEKRSIDVLENYLDKINYMITWQPWSKLFKRSIVVANGVTFNKTLHSCNDFNFFFEYFRYIKDVLFVNTPVTIYTTERLGSISSTKKMRRIESNTYAYSEFFNNVLNTDPTKEKILDYASYLYMCVFDLCDDLQKNDIQYVQQIISKDIKIYSYSQRKIIRFKRFIYKICGLRNGARIYNSIRNIISKLLKNNRLSEI